MLFGYITSHPCFCKKTQVPFGWALEYTPKKTAIELGKFFFFPIRMTRYLIFRYKKHIQVYLQFMLEVSFIRNHFIGCHAVAWQPCELQGPQPRVPWLKPDFVGQQTQCWGYETWDTRDTWGKKDRQRKLLYNFLVILIFILQ